MGRTGRVLIVAAVAVALVRPATAGGENARQPFGLVASYLRLASRYRSGDVTAVGDLRGWPLLAVDTAVGALRGSPRGSIALRVVETAVVLEVHAGLHAQQAESPAEAQAHINAGIRVFEWSRRAWERGYWSEQDEAPRPRIDPATFYATVAAGCLSLWGVVLADDVAARGLRQFPTDPQLLYVAGCVKEALVFVHTVEHKTGDAEGARRAAEKLLRDTLAVEPQNAEARLRLARVLVDEDRLIEAQPLLEGVAHTSDTRLRYLAWLFLGRLHDRQQSWGEAQDAYSRAVREQPDNQAARLGLACVLEQQSGPAAARPQVLDTLALSGRLDRRNDPWWDYLLGPYRPGGDRLARQLVDELHELVLAP